MWASVPTFLLTKCMIPCLPEKHLWKNKRFSLQDWHKHQTNLCKLFDFVFWVSGACICFSVLILSI